MLGTNCEAMPIDVSDPKTRITMEQAAQHAGVDESTIWRWASDLDYKKRPCQPKIETALWGGIRYTTLEALKCAQRNGAPRRRAQQAPVVSSDEARILDILRKKGLLV
jgi:hypothetical protein